MPKTSVALYLLPLMLQMSVTFAADQPRGYSTVDTDYRHAPEESYEKWKDAKFGLRIHWGVYSMYNVEASWPYLKYSAAEKMQYSDLYKSFNPIHFNAEQWMAMMSRCGLKFFTFTTRHHDGFSMFDTKTVVTQRVNYTAPGGPRLETFGKHYSIKETPFARDVVKELTDAARRFGIGIGLYYSNPDWFDADFRMEWNHYLGLAFADPRLNKTDPAAYSRYIARHREQVRELLSNYGRIDTLCLDMDTPEEAWPDIKETVKMARELQPWLLMRDRGIGAYGDYTTPERWVPSAAGKEDPRVAKRDWMAIDPMGTIFAYEADGTKLRSGEWILSTLIDVVAKGGVFEVGIGPDGNGLFHPLAIRNLEYVGDWLKVNGEAIYATRPRMPYAEGDVRYTASKDGKYIYAVAVRWPGEHLELKSVRARPGAAIEMLGGNGPLAWHASQDGGIVIDIPAALQDPLQRRSKQAWVFRIPAVP